MDKAGQSEARFIIEALRRGWEIAQPFHHAQGYDFVARRGKDQPWETVQVKTAYMDHDGRGNPVLTVSLRRVNEKGSRPYTKGDFDLLFVAHEAGCWLIPWEAVKDRRSCIVVESAKYAAFRLD